MQKAGHANFTKYGKGGFVPFWKSIDAKKPGKGYGVQIAGDWYWYDKMISEVRSYLARAQG